MKKIVLASFLICIAVSVYAMDMLKLDMMAGINFGFTPEYRSAQYDLTHFNNNPQTNIQSFNQSYIDFSAFFDATYARIDLGYMVNPVYGSLTTTTANQGATFTTNMIATNTMSFLSISLLGKYPFKISEGINIWPVAGFEWDINTVYTVNSTNMISTNNFSGLWLKIGAGADIKVADHLYIVPLIMFGFDLTPRSLIASPDSTMSLSDYISNYHYSESAFRFDINVGVAYKF